MSGEVWVTECKYSGIYAGGKRYCSYKKMWVAKIECDNCRIYMRVGMLYARN